MARSRNWCFTINNPTDVDDTSLQESNYKYLLYQKEKGKEETEHYQGLITFKESKSLAQMKKINKIAHWEVTRSLTASVKYCKKEESRIDGPYEFGSPPQQGSRSDFASIVDMAKEQTTMKEVAELFPGQSVRYSNGINKILTMFTEPRTFQTKIIIFWGASGTGKTRRAMSFPFPYKTMVSYNQLFMDGYDPNYHKTIVVDDFYGGIKWTGNK